MKRYTVPSYADPFRSERGYIKYTSRHDKRCNWIVAAIVAFSAGVAVCTLISEYISPLFGA